MDRVRGILMLALGAFVLYRGWVMIHSGRRALWACVLGVLAIVLGIWRVRGKAPGPRF